MAQMLMFVYTLIIFLSLFLVITNSVRIPCVTVADCPPTILPVFYECIDKFCMLHIE
ncbi:putative Late nodulin [Medicago truncatula]|uniref:Nodule Cysteine-Rich (NCR) secreted peptide n=1 Tax=Medicago truncatula TaxID=3880 RepID=G7KSG9_MEDTR|nr:Nodule Cysteine-Rich (NCR) secreted peptide [Medicago truncatula]RHN47155.1 putative Late nodulin [Medicago truncatula]